MKATAYAVLALDTTLSPAVVRGASIFSEPSPTTDDSRTRFALLFKIEGNTFAEAARIAESVLASAAYNWIGVMSRSGSRVSRIAEVVS